MHLKFQAGGSLARTDGGDVSVVDGLEKAQLNAAALQPGASPALRHGMARVGVDFNAWHQAAGKAQLAGHSVVVDLVFRLRGGIPRPAPGRAAALRARAVPGIRRHDRRGLRLGHRDLCRPAAGDRQLALGGHPVFLRAGKALPHTVTEVRLLLRRTPRLAFLPQQTRAEPNQVVLRIEPDPGLRLQLSALAGQSWRPVHLDTWFRP